MFEQLVRRWDGAELVCRYDQVSEAWMLIGVHSTVLGPAMGGTRMKPYGSLEDALADVLRLSAGMTLKQAIANLPYGGGKAVLAVPEVPRGPARRELLLGYADLVASLGGTYVTAADMNTGQRDMDVIAERCPYVLGRSPERGGSGDPGAGTANGVFHGIRASVRYLMDRDDLYGLTVLIQGVGSVGRRLAELLAAGGATILLSDVDPERAKLVAGEADAQIVEPDDVIGTVCDIYAPCAVGGTLSIETIPRLRCRIVAGAANNQLAWRDDADRLRDAGILYAPDYVINAGGVIHLAGLEALEWTEDQVTEKIARIGDTLTEVYRSADAEGIATEAAAARIAKTRIEARAASRR